MKYAQSAAIVGKAEQMMGHIDAWGDSTAFPHFAIGWGFTGKIQKVTVQVK